MNASGRNTALSYGRRFPRPPFSTNCVAVLAPEPALVMFSPTPPATYVTGGVGLNITKAGSGASTATQFVLNGGLGKRLPYESAVFRPEAFIAYAFKTSTVPSEFSIGVRLGLSFWH